MLASEPGSSNGSARTSAVCEGEDEGRGADAERQSGDGEGHEAGIAVPEPADFTAQAHRCR